MRNLVSKFPKFRYHATRIGLFKFQWERYIARLWKPPVWCHIFGHICYITVVISNFVLKFPNSRYHGNKGQSQKHFFSAPYVEAMFQFFEYRSINDVSILVTDAGTGDRTRQMILYSVHAATHWIGQTKTYRLVLSAPIEVHSMTLNTIPHCPSLDA